MDAKIRPQEPMVKIPIGMDCRLKGQLDPWKCSWVKTETWRKTVNLQADMEKQLSRDAE